MKIITLLTLSITFLMLTSCGNSDNKSNENTELTGVWKHNINNELFLIVENTDSLLISACAAEGEAVELIKEELDNNAGLNIISASEIELINDSQSEEKLIKINAQNYFDSGSFKLTSDNIDNVSSSENVCAFRGTGSIRNTISVPYLDSYIELVIINNTQTTGEFDLSTGDVSLFFESQAWPDNSFISAYSGTVKILEYTKEKLNVEYSVYDLSGNEYIGSANVDIN